MLVLIKWRFALNVLLDSLFEAAFYFKDENISFKLDVEAFNKKMSLETRREWMNVSLFYILLMRSTLHDSVFVMHRGELLAL